MSKETKDCLDSIIIELTMGCGRFQLEHNGNHYCLKHNLECPAQERHSPHWLPYCKADKIMENYKK